MTRLRQQGMALVLVMWLTMLLTVMAAAFALDTRRETGLLRVARNSAQGRALCEGAMHYAVAKLSAKNPLLRWRADGTVYEVAYGNSRVRLQLLDEAAKVDLNTAQQGMLQGLLSAIGMGPDEAARMASVIMDWRDADELRRFQGAEAEDYRQAGLNFGPRNKPFQAVEELQTVLGMTPMVYQLLEPLVTVYSQKPGIDPSIASVELLRRLPGMDANVLESYLQIRARIAVLPPAVAAAQGLTLPLIKPPPAISFVKGAQEAIGIRAEASLAGSSGTADDANTSVIAVVARGKVLGQPLSILRWRESAGTGVSLFGLPIFDGIVLDALPP